MSKPSPRVPRDLHSSPVEASRLGGNQSNARRHPEGCLQKHTIGVLAQRGMDLVSGSVSPPLLLASDRDARPPCEPRLFPSVVHRAEMTSRAPERVLSRGVQAGLKVRMVTGPQKARVGLAEEERRWKLL